MLPSRFPRRVRLGLYALAALILLVLCVTPSQDLPDPGTGDRFEHMAAWFVLTLAGFVLAPRRRLAIPAFALAYGALIEVLQAAMPFGRHGDPRDLLADAIGVALACLAWLVLRRLAPRIIDAA
ncbi:MAG: VanZ family protein [Phenylobacterium sp.]|jgi:VanZ family protein|uniref:VanZ family protein n=1 Tax=Phenylobacterium sp. TaxID=1871053 RepID=UPI001A2B2400|nr:VanZ family protein [Phenylobacterium sp.]MBJ7412277.1 VanZ family protein [Phenylobacterium sp.]